MTLEEHDEFDQERDEEIKEDGQIGRYLRIKLLPHFSYQHSCHNHHRNCNEESDKALDITSRYAGVQVKPPYCVRFGSLHYVQHVALE
mmetsp:Transcript_32666/g.36203  ORF Transcript_32666/g.36203 Transcript_32666/m.36203 type:complete len:88 (+) Transcript_32666:515-778(+)